MKFNVHAGHTLSGTPGSGAVGLVNESTEVRKIKNEVISLLRKEGHVVHDCTNDRASSMNENLKNIVAAANKNKVELDVSIHLNAGVNDNKGDGKSTGVEVLIYLDNSKAKNEAQRICNEIASLGFRNRGVKVRSGLYVLKNTNSPALLIECFFVDDKDDVNLYHKVGVSAIAKAIVQGILNKKVGVIVEPIKAASPSKPSIVYEAHVQDIGWQGKRRDGETAGTTGQALRLEALTVKLENTNANLQMEAHIQDKGWTSVRSNGEVLGTIGESLRLEAIKINSELNIQYRVHIENIGWTPWVSNGAVAGTTGEAKRIEAIEIKLV